MKRPRLVASKHIMTCFEIIELSLSFGLARCFLQLSVLQLCMQESKVAVKLVFTSLLFPDHRQHWQLAQLCCNPKPG